VAVEQFEYLKQPTVEQESRGSSHLELCVTLYNLGDYFMASVMTNYALQKIMQFCDFLVADLYTIIVPRGITMRGTATTRHRPIDAFNYVGIDDDPAADTDPRWAAALKELLTAVDAAYSMGTDKQPSRLVLAAAVQLVLPRVNESAYETVTSLCVKHHDFSVDMFKAANRGIKRSWVPAEDRQPGTLAEEPKLDVDRPDKCSGCRRYFTRRKAVIDPSEIRTYVGVAWCFQCTSEHGCMVKAPWRQFSGQHGDGGRGEDAM